jgi:Mg2+-importing ATPase
MRKEIFGLEEEEAKERLKKYGPNVFWKEISFDWLRFLREEVFNLFNILLFFVFLISFFGGGKKIESFLILLFLFISIFVSLISELNFHHLSKNLKKFLRKKVLVLRSGKKKIIDAEFLVPGDLIYLSKGERIPADGEIINCLNFLVNEQVLTGESKPVEKKMGDEIFGGTEVLEGEAEILITKTGKEMRFGKIGELTSETSKKSAYQKELEKFTSHLLILVLIFVLGLFLFHFFTKEIEKKEILAFALILGISIVPELFPPIAVFTLTVYSKRFAKRKTIVKRISAIEDLGVIDVLCTDKTGTITTNELKLEKILAKDENEFLKFATSLTFGISQKYLSDFGRAIVKELDKKTKDGFKKIKLVNRKLFDPSLRISQGILEIEGKKILVVGGAPEFIFEYCQKEEEWLEKVEEYSKEGFRTYALAKKEIEKEEFITKEKKIEGMEFLGLGIFRDAIKPSAKEALILAEKLGVDVKVLTGDHPEVARKVALEIGLIEEKEKVFTEKELLSFSEEEFERVVENYNVFARVSPETKYKIVKALQKRHRVGYLGEGINDLPTIKLADVGIVVDTAQDAAKDVADVILLEKDLKVILEGIALGRQAFFNLIKFLRHTMSDNFGNFFAIGFLSFFLPFLPLTPLQILLTDFLTDFPLFALPTDNVLPSETKKPARYKTKELFSLLVGLGAVAAVFIGISFLIFKNHPPEFLRTIVFLTTTLTGISVFYSIRTDDWFFKSQPSKLIHLTILLSLFFLFSFLCFAPLRSWFNFSPLSFKILFSLFILDFIVFILINDVAKKIILKYFIKSF